MADWVVPIMEDGDYAMVAGMMFLENVYPPIPSELVMPLAGYTAHQGDLTIWLVVLFGSLGSLTGALFWYYVGLWLGCDRLKRFARRHGRLLTLTPDEIDKADARSDSGRGRLSRTCVEHDRRGYCPLVCLSCRHVPAYAGS